AVNCVSSCAFYRRPCPGGQSDGLRVAGSRSELPVRRSNVRAVDVGNGARAAVAHCEFEFALQDFNDPLDAGLTERTEAPQKGPADPDGFRAQRERLENVGTAAKSAVDEHR